MSTLKIVDVPVSVALPQDAFADDILAVRESGQAGQFEWPADELKPTLAKLHTSAKSVDLSVRVVSKEETDEGTVLVTFIVRDRVTRPRATDGADD